MNIQRVAVIGTGMMGPGIAAVVALAGYDVTLIGERPDWAADGVAKSLAVMDQLLANGLTTPAAHCSASASTTMPSSSTGIGRTSIPCSRSCRRARS